MCTSIVEIVGADGAGKGGDGWFDLTHSVVSYDHPHHALLEEAITIDFVNAALPPGTRVAVELTLESAKELSGALTRAIAAAEIEESARLRPRRSSNARRRQRRSCESENKPVVLPPLGQLLRSLMGF